MSSCLKRGETSCHYLILPSPLCFKERELLPSERMGGKWKGSKSKQSLIVKGKKARRTLQLQGNLQFRLYIRVDSEEETRFDALITGWNSPYVAGVFLNLRLLSSSSSVNPLLSKHRDSLLNVRLIVVFWLSLTICSQNERSWFIVSASNVNYWQKSSECNQYFGSCHLSHWMARKITFFGLDQWPLDFSA